MAAPLHILPLLGHSGTYRRPVATRKAAWAQLPKSCQPSLLRSDPRGSYALVPELWLHRRHAGSRAFHLPPVSAVYLLRELRVRRIGGSVGRPALHGTAVRLRAGARVWTHLYRARVRGGDSRRDAPADRRPRTARAHPRGAAR